MEPGSKLVEHGSSGGVFITNSEAGHCTQVPLCLDAMRWDQGITLKWDWYNLLDQWDKSGHVFNCSACKKDGVCIICLVQELSYNTLKENNSKIDQVLRDQLSGCHMKYPQFATRYLSYCFLAIPQQSFLIRDFRWVEEYFSDFQSFSYFFASKS